MTWFRCGMKKSDDSEKVDALLTKSITEISSNITRLGSYALYGCSSITSVNFPELTQTDTYSFGYTTILTDVTLPKCITIGGSAFGYSGLTTLVLPKCTSISSFSFTGSHLNSLTLGSDTMCTLANVNSFNSTPFATTGAGGTIYVPSDLVSTYEADATWAAVLALNANNRIQAITP